MDQHRPFLEHVLGPDGAGALLRAATRCPALGKALVPRAALAWVQAESRCGGHLGELPGRPGVLAEFCKNDQGTLDGQVGDVVLAEAGPIRAAAAVSVALGVDLEGLVAQDVQLEQLGKSIDLLARVRKLRALKAEQEGKGKAAAPRPPTPPEAADAPDKQPGGKGLKTGAPRAPKPPGLRVLKSQLGTPCPACGGIQFDQKVFSGCACFQHLAKAVQVTEVGGQLHLDFSAPWDRELVLQLAEAVR